MLFLSAGLNDQDGGTKPPTDASSLQGVTGKWGEFNFIFVSKNDLPSSKTCASSAEGGGKGSGALRPGRSKQSERRARGGYRVGEGFSSSWGVSPLSCRAVRRGRPVILGPHQDNGDSRTTEETRSRVTRTAHDGADAPQGDADGSPAQRGGPRHPRSRPKRWGRLRPTARRRRRALGWRERPRRRTR